MSETCNCGHPELMHGAFLGQPACTGSVDTRHTTTGGDTLTPCQCKGFMPMLAVAADRERDLDRETLRRWRIEAVTTRAQERLWLNRCEALCEALLDARARLDRVENEAPDHIKRIVRG